MKTKLVLAGIALLLAGQAKAQYEERVLQPRERAVFGMKAGVNRSNVWDENGQDFKAQAKTGFAGGIFVSIPLVPYIGIQPEVMISQKGYQSTGVFLGAPYADVRTTTYLDIPILLAFKPSPYFSILLGPQYSYLIHQKDQTSFGSAGSTTEQEFRNDNVRKNIFGLTGGADLNIKHIVLSARVGWDMMNNNGDGSSTTPRYKNEWMQFTIGFRI